MEQPFIQPENYPTNEEKFVKWIEDFRSTSGFKKLLNYLDEIVKKEHFQKTVKQIRKKYNIPVDGFKEDKTKPSEFLKTSKGQMEIPYNTEQEWEFYKNHEIKIEIYKEAKALSTQYEYQNELAEVFENYIHNNKIEIMYEGTWKYNMCVVSDLVEEREDPYGQDYNENMDKLYPIAIRIRPEATKRDILDFINKMYKYDIHWSQLKYQKPKQKMGKSKKENTKVQERNDFIFANKDLPRKEIMKLITEKFGWQNNLDVAYIGKIISLETKKRKEV